MSYDLKIVGGDIIDGTGSQRYRGDVGVRDGRIVALGDAAEPAAAVIEAEGRIVAPGFVDIHTHYDAQVLWDDRLSISPWHGVTTALMGNCGFGLAPTRPEHRELMLKTLEKVEDMSIAAIQAGIGDDWGFVSFPEYLDKIEARGVAINVGALLGHTPLRLFAMGEDAVNREASKEEVATMCGLVREAMEAGAMGFATSHSQLHQGYAGNPVPSRLASLDEIDALVGETARAGGVLQATVGRTLFFDQFAELARRHGVTVSWTALLSGMSGPGSHRKMLDRTRALLREGLSIVPQVSCRPLSSEFDFLAPGALESRPVFAPVLKTDREGKKRIYADPGFRQALKDDLAADARHMLAGWADRTVISYCPAEPDLEERRLVEVAAGRAQHPVDLALDLSLASDLTARFRTALMNFDEEEVAELLTDPDIVLGLSDAGAHASQLCDACYSTHLLGHWVREKGVLTLEQAVHMLTGRPASVFGIVDRGLLSEGRPADIVVFDPATIAASPLRRVSDLPAGSPRLISDASGIDAVIVNGTPIRRHGKDVAMSGSGFPGKVLRRGRAA